MEGNESSLIPSSEVSTQLPEGYLNFQGEWVAANDLRIVISHSVIFAGLGCAGLKWIGLILQVREDGTVFPIPSFWDQEGKSANPNLNIKRARCVDAYGDKAQW